MQLATWVAQTAPEFPDQVTTSSLLQNLVYASGTVGAIVILAGLMLVDVGGVRRVNVFAAAAEKFTSRVHLWRHRMLPVPGHCLSKRFLAHRYTRHWRLSSPVQFW
jgi:hypothetical protein